VNLHPLTFVNDQHLRPQPSRRSLLVPPDLAHEHIWRLEGETDASKRMKRDAANVACGDARGGGDGDGVGCSGVFLSEVLDDLAKQNGLAGTCSGQYGNGACDWKGRDCPD
jgi:hypothetical protein